MFYLKNRYLAIARLLPIACIAGCDNAVDDPAKTEGKEKASKVSDRANETIQAQISRTFETFQGIKKGELGDAYRELTALRKTAKVQGADDEELVRQLAIFIRTIHSEYGLVVRVILDRLEIPDRPIIRALAPHLDATNQSLRSFAYDWFQYHDNASRWDPDKPLEPLNFSEYGAYLRNRVRKKEAIPEAFIIYIYSREPSHALLAFYYAHEEWPPKRRDLLWSEHVISNAIWMKENGFDEAFKKAQPEAIEHLQQLSRHDQWWVRLYVAKIISYPGLEDGSIHEQLLKDENELVQRAIAETKEKLMRRRSTPDGGTKTGAGRVPPSKGVKVIRDGDVESPARP